MQNNPYILLLGIFFAIWLGAKSWRRNRLRRAVRDLPTSSRRLLGPEPDYLPPSQDSAPPELAGYLRLHRRSGQIQKGLWGLAGLWLAFVIFLVLRKQFL